MRLISCLCLSMLLSAVLLCAAGPGLASDHLDTRTVVEDPRADIGDLYAWMSPDRERVNLVMTLVGHELSDALVYAFHLDSGERFGATSSTVRIECHTASPGEVECRSDALADVRLQVFAGVRDDPFFNNVKGARDAYQVAAAAMKNGASSDAAHCPALDAETSKRLLDTWRHTEGGPAQNFLQGWTPMSIVVSLPRTAATRGGPLLAVWATTSNARRQLDRMGRPLTGNALLAPLAHDDVSDALKEQYNSGAPEAWPKLIPAIQETLGLYDGFDGVCGNQWLADTDAPTAQRYRRLAEVLADDRLWIDTASDTCETFMAVERKAFGDDVPEDCGGRAPTLDAVDVYRSLLATGTPRGVDDGVDRDELEHSAEEFPFLAAPAGDPPR